MKSEFCKYCGLENKISHHCSGKKAYMKGKVDGMAEALKIEVKE